MKKININREPITTEEINKNKNFKNVIGNAYKIPKPMYKTPKFFGAMVLIVVVTTVIVLEYFNKKESKIEGVSYVCPPIKELDKKLDTYKVDAEHGDTIKHATGTKIIIPAEAFVDENGNAVKGQVDIEYREFNNQVDIFFSGIPMGYDSGATKYQFQSAGMCDIKGFQNNKPVFIKDSKALTVNMPTQYDGAGYNMYYLDTIKKN